MRITLARRNAAVHFVATTETGATLSIDGAPAIGGEGLGARPMEVVLAGLGGCSGIDVANILRKQRETVTDLVITVEGEREPNVEPSLFRAIHVHFQLRGPADDAKVARAVALSMDKYCSVARILERSATITYSYAVEPAPLP
jgi:putative redox protein